MTYNIGMAEEQRTCKTCGFTGPLAQFSKGNLLKDGTQSYRKVCRKCRTDEAAENYRLRIHEPEKHKELVAERERSLVWRKCHDCDYEGPVESFPPRGDHRGRPTYAYYCYPCRRVRMREYDRRQPRTPERAERQRRRGLLRKYKMTVEQWDAMFEAQGRRCAICRTDEPGDKNWHTDHDNSCCEWGAGGRTCGKCVRGILCRQCNTALGLVRDDPFVTQGMTDYLTADRRPALKAV